MDFTLIASTQLDGSIKSELMDCGIFQEIYLEI